MRICLRRPSDKGCLPPQPLLVAPGHTGVDGAPTSPWAVSVGPTAIDQPKIDNRELAAQPAETGSRGIGEFAKAPMLPAAVWPLETGPVDDVLDMPGLSANMLLTCSSAGSGTLENGTKRAVAPAIARPDADMSHISVHDRPG